MKEKYLKNMCVAYDWLKSCNVNSLQNCHGITLLESILYLTGSEYNG